MLSAGGRLGGHTSGAHAFPADPHSRASTSPSAAVTTCLHLLGRGVPHRLRPRPEGREGLRGRRVHGALGSSRGSGVPRAAASEEHSPGPGRPLPAPVALLLAHGARHPPDGTGAGGGARAGCLGRTWGSTWRGQLPKQQPPPHLDTAPRRRDLPRQASSSKNLHEPFQKQGSALGPAAATQAPRVPSCRRLC